MEETNNSELLITEPPEIETPAPKQEETKKQEEKKMSGVDLSKFSLEELQAALEKKKVEEAKPKFELDETDSSNLARFLFDNFAVRLAVQNTNILDEEISKYPGNLTNFCYLYDNDNKRTNDKNEVVSIHVVSAYEDYVIDESIYQSSPAFSTILSKIGETHFDTNYEYRPGRGRRMGK